MRRAGPLVSVSDNTTNADVRHGSISTLLAEATRPFLSAMPPIATKAVSHSATSRSAMSRPHRRKARMSVTPKIRAR
jgi:hypothetical protein